MTEQCLFCKIARGEIPAKVVYEDEEFVAFRDINAHAPVHVLVIPRAHYPTIMDSPAPGMLGRAMEVVQIVAQKENVHESGFHTVINHRDDGGQTVYHVHIHILGGRFLSWPPG
jgi:histidine triad (HIT) family protein